MIGLYAIRHIASRSAYFGSSVDIKRRFKEHRTGLKFGKHHCRHLQNSWNRHGEEKFEFILVKETLTHAEAKEIEQAFLDIFFKNGLYNSNNKAIGFASGDASHAKRPDFHMKTVMQRLSPDERREKYGKAKGTKRNPAAYIASAAIRNANPEYSKKLSESCKGKRNVVECPYCGLSGGGGNMRRYHFENCKGKK